MAFINNVKLINSSNRCTGNEMDEQRQRNIAYEYLCHLEEAKMWMEGILKETLPSCTQLEEYLRNGIALAKLGNLISPDVVPKFRIYDYDLKRYNNVGLQFRHTDNISYWIKSLNAVSLPQIFHPETTDVYDKKNMPKVIFCIHALAAHLFKLGKASLIQDLYGKINFSDDVIKDKSTELQESGVVMPTFQGIGRMLGCASTSDSSELHDSIIAVNKAIDSQDSEGLIEKLSFSRLNISHILPEYGDIYLKTLADAKTRKTESALDRSLNDSYDQDEYDSVLTQAEIQGHVTFINVQGKWNEILSAMRKHDSDVVYSVLKQPCLELHDLIEENKGFYASELQDRIESSVSMSVTSASGQKAILQNIIKAGNKEAAIERERKACVDEINKELSSGNSDGFSKALLKLEPLLPPGTFHQFAVPLYYEEMKVDIIESGEQLGYCDIVASLRVLSDIAAISVAIDSGCPDQMWQALSNPNIHVSSLIDPELKLQYWRALTACRQFKTDEHCFCTLLCYMDIHDCIALVNEEHKESGSAIASLHVINNAVKSDNIKVLGNELKNPALKITEQISPRDLPLLLYILKKQCEEHPEGTELWLVDLQEAVRRVSNEVKEVVHDSDWLAKINHSLERNDMEETIMCVNSRNDFKINNKDSLLCFVSLQQCKCLKEKSSNCSWSIHYTSSGLKSYLLLSNEKYIKYSWEKPDDIKTENEDNSPYLTLHEIKEIMYNLKNNSTNGKVVKNVEDWLVPLQARSKGYLLRKRLRDYKLEKEIYEKKVIKIQVGLHANNDSYQVERWWRDVHQKKQNKLLRKQRKISAPKYSRDNKSLEYKITKIQALWRGRQTRKKYLSFVLQSNPSFKTVQRCVHILEFSTDDYQRELQLQALKAEVMQTIRRNNELAKKLDEMDVTIGLLIENRISLQNAIAAGKRMNEVASGSAGLKALSASSRRQLSAYQHLFYTLQTSTHYLAKLLFCLPQSQCSKFLNIVILSLFNFRTTCREEYLLLKLFQHALHEEIRCKIMKPADIVSGDPLVLKLAVNYARQHSGQNTLRHILGPVVIKVLNNKQLSIDTNPVNIYNKWRNELELYTGKPSDLPYPVSQEKALSYEEVRKRLDYSISTLKSNALTFLNHIMQSKAAIPYGLLFIARELSIGLQKKFPDIPEKEVLKVIGNLIYYRFINSAIVAPDAFDIIGPDYPLLTNTQRHNLASIAKILQFAASKKGFGDESPHLQSLNPFLVECHEVFKRFLRSCCNVEDVEKQFSITEFTEVTLINQPSIHITLMELKEIHRLLVEYADQIAPDPHDQLHELLADLGPVPTAAQLMGYVCDDVADAERHLDQTQVSLTLVNKYEVVEDNKTDLTKLFIKTKELLVQVLPYLSGHNLPGGLRIEPTPQQEEEFLLSQHNRNKDVNTSECISGLRECKAKLRKLLSQLEDTGLVSRDDGYQDIISSIGNDILNKGRYRAIQLQELQTVKNAKKTLDEKTKFYEDKVKFYNEYINKCLENISQNKRNVHTLKTENNKKLKSKHVLKYTASQLKEKGVLVSIEGLPSSQFKNVLFEITPSDNVGIFKIKGRFMGVEVETVEINIQKLLQLQYEGIGVMDIFGKAKININILLYLINKKFYC